MAIRNDTAVGQKIARTGGRPSRQDAALLRGQILDAATTLFFSEGYGVTSIEAIATHAQISKRTFYYRFANKAEVFHAVVHRVVEQLKPTDMSELFKGETIFTILLRLAGLIIQAALTPQALALHRLILAEASRFPEIAAMAAAEGTRQEAIKNLANLLAEETKAGHLHIDKPEYAAQQFLHLVLGEPQRRAMGLGAPMSEDERHDWIKSTVAFFLRGCGYSSQA